MADDELVFRGLNADECTEFIRKIHKIAYDERKLRDFEWIADRAMICFTGDALVWYDEQSLETQTDWSLLRRAMLTHYVNSNRAARLEPEPVPARETEQALVPPAPPSGGPSAALVPAADSKIVYRIKVAAPGYIGYISKEYGAGIDGRYGILTSEPDESLLVQQCFLIYDSPGIALRVMGSERDGLADYLCLTSAAGVGSPPLGTWSGCLAIARQLKSKTSSPSPSEFSTKDDLRGHPSVAPAPWIIDTSGILSAACFYFSSIWSGSYNYYSTSRTPETLKANVHNHTTVIGLTESGEKTLYFWSRKVWEDKEEQFVAEMYLERVV